MNSGLFKIDVKDVGKGIVVAALTGFLLPVAAAIQSPGFNLLTADWNQIVTLAVNGALVGFVSYIIKNFLSDEQGKVLGKIG